MPIPSALEVCKRDLFTPEEELRQKYAPIVVSRVMRIRDIYNFVLANPEVKDKTVVDTIMTRYEDIRKTQAYSDLQVIKALIPMVNRNSREFHRWRYGEMILETYRMAKKRKDTKTMERAATSYAKYFKVDVEEEIIPDYDKIIVQPFTPTIDPSVLGLKPIPNAFEYIDSLTKELARDLPDIMDVEAEEADLQEGRFFTKKEESQQEHTFGIADTEGTSDHEITTDNH